MWKKGTKFVGYEFLPMTQEQAEEIAYHWHYEGEYAFYDITADEEDLKEFLDPLERGDSHFSVFIEGDLVGFFSFDAKEDGTVALGLGMKPGRTGQGEGILFLQSGLEFADKIYAPKRFVLSVAAFNQRAIRVYERAGFHKVREFIQETNGGHYDFISMEFNRTVESQGEGS